MHKPLVGINEPWMIVNNWKFTVPQLFFVNKFGFSMVLKQSIYCNSDTHPNTNHRTPNPFFQWLHVKF